MLQNLDLRYLLVAWLFLLQGNTVLKGIGFVLHLFMQFLFRIFAFCFGPGISVSSHTRIRTLNPLHFLVLIVIDADIVGKQHFLRFFFWRLFIELNMLDKLLFRIGHLGDPLLGSLYDVPVLQLKLLIKRFLSNLIDLVLLRCHSELNEVLFLLLVFYVDRQPPKLSCHASFRLVIFN